MKEEGLRKENLVLESNHIVKIVTGFNEDIVYCKTAQIAPCEVDELDINCISEIPLTTDLICKLGAVYSHGVFDLEIYKLGNYYISVMDGVFKLITKSTNTGSWEPIKIVEYVHRLQNLYFELTDEKLIIK